MDLTTTAWTLLIVAAVLVGISKTGLPGIGILSIALVQFAVGRDKADLGNGLLLILLLIGDVLAVAWYRRHANWRHLVRLLPPAAGGIIIGYFLARLLQYWQVESSLLSRLIGGIVLTMLVANRWWMMSRKGRADSAVPRSLAFAVVIGGLAGVTTMLANAAGPLLVIYLLAMRLEKHAFIGTSAWYFLLLNGFKVPFMAHLGWINTETLRMNLMLAPVVLGGAMLGIVIIRHMPQRIFRLVAELLAAAAAVKLAIG